MITWSARSPELPPYSVAFGHGRHRRVLDLPLVVWLAVIWVLLWGTFSWANLVNGVVVAVLLCLAFPLPPADLGLRLHPWGILKLLLYLLWDMWISGVRVTKQIFVDYPHRAAVLAIPLRCRSELMLTATAVAVSNVPGGSVIELRRATATLFVHVLDADDPKALETARRSVWRTEELTVRAFGSREEIARVSADPRQEDAT
ncbi:Na+/H+ antiporter subunit E [Streptomyces albidoflavus]|uniref:Na+/H+ antiporter subunit E n=2 Tax=Streptomyces TaxID=1883 RepID=D6BCF5_9ACTN|nr:MULTISPECIES: Na+/H+ antiporter subunit E [Streptomyces]MYQ71968.1 Na+/H+ antiporter subunit E [Streptomyces sp. SID4934]MYW59151.1 Na+/H+ antiporter subunit E [Streptomyces sp. SID8370]MYW88964.1 Na+/H+ antiporter subunit E [Streptomyces sp. SID8371]MYX51709.1 Na+/H+ antiporter subunit E [Streptomyces sp. SID8385]MYX85315.1 Na+/H+ antiporter subunit E [Streptomyces sp. SID4915]QLA55915.1 Na+/H+ antiporter subunit E [Streptomyces violascens]SCD63192.1 multisubunit sodium/proton antiporter